jgi:hypothetical protein
MIKNTGEFKSFYTMVQQMLGKEIRCLDCICCCLEEKKCYPKSEDCEPEYDLNDEDIYTMRKYDCDFYTDK